jgi:hypothetical protein
MAAMWRSIESNRKRQAWRNGGGDISQAINGENGVMAENGVAKWRNRRKCHLAKSEMAALKAQSMYGGVSAAHQLNQEEIVIKRNIAA